MVYVLNIEGKPLMHCREAKASWKKLKLLETRKNLLTERRMQEVGIV